MPLTQKRKEFIDSFLLEMPERIQNLRGKTIVIKYGGNAMVDEHLKHSFAYDVVQLKRIGMNPIVVHGGGPQINDMLNRLDIKSNFIQGMRVTDQQTMQIVEMVLGGHVNKDIVNLILNQGGQAVGLTGKDGNMIEAKKMRMHDEKSNNSQFIDLGFVGEVLKINQSLLNVLCENNFIPVIAPIGRNSDGETFNINADLVAGEVAKSILAEKLLLLTNTPGVLDENGKLLRELDAHKVEFLIKSGVIFGGMLPKIHGALDAIKNGVQSVHIIDGRLENALLLEVLTPSKTGTQIY